MTQVDPWLRVVQVALTGTTPDATVGGGEGADEAPGPDPAALVRALASSGWDAERLQAHRAQRQADEQPWPHPEAASQIAALGAGRYHAVLAEVRRLTGLTGLRPQLRQGPVVIGAAEQRLLAERPPHHGNV